VKPIHLNLAARPYRDYRPIYAVVIATSILIAFLMLNNLDTYVRYVHDTRTTRNEITSIQAQIQQEHRRAEAATRDTSTIDLISLSKEAKFVNTQLAQRAFSWSELLNQLEAVLPGNVRITSISPQFADNGLVHLSLACEGKSPDTLLTTINRLQRDPHFSNPFPTNQESTPSGYRFGLGVDYRPTVMRVVAR
jgi:type IV pilus assembly protein PilN